MKKFWLIAFVSLLASCVKQPADNELVYEIDQCRESGKRAVMLCHRVAHDATNCRLECRDAKTH